MLFALLAFFLAATYLAQLLGLIRIRSCFLLVFVPVVFLLYIGLFISPLNELGWAAPYLSTVGLNKGQIVSQLGEPRRIIVHTEEFPT